MSFLGDGRSQVGPQVSDNGVRIRLRGQVASLGSVRLEVDWPLNVNPDFRSDGSGGWVLDAPRPPVQRFEYKLRMRSGGYETVETDPTNPHLVPGPFGPKSEIRFPDYREPDWLPTPANGSTLHIEDNHSRLDAPIPIWLFSPASLAADEPAPLLIAQDGSDLSDRGRLLSWACASGRPPRVALLDPPHGHRNAWYAANPAYADHVAEIVLPKLKSIVPVSSVVGLGVSLGALATMTIHRRHPDALDGLALQSGSFFRPELDSQESGWPEFRQVCEAVAAMTSAPAAELRQVPVLLTVGAVEENRANNERMAGALAFQRYPIDARIVPDAHNLIGWRDAWSPGLDRLMERLL